MKIKIWVPEEIEIPTAEFPELARKVREDWSQPTDAPVHMEDLLRVAARDGLAALPEGYKLDDEWDEPLTDAEIAEFED